MPARKSPTQAANSRLTPPTGVSQKMNKLANQEKALTVTISNGVSKGMNAVGNFLKGKKK